MPQPVPWVRATTPSTPSYRSRTKTGIVEPILGRNSTHRPSALRVGCGVSSDGPSASTDPNHPAATILARCIADVEGAPPRFELCPGVLETRWYVQVGDMPEDKKAPKPRRASWPKDKPVENADLEAALVLLSLPRELGHHPQTGLPIFANVGRFGPYLLHDGKFKSIPKQYDVYAIDLTQAVEVLSAPSAKRGGGAPGRDLGKHPEDGQPITVKEGRYGPYVSHGKVNATLRKDMAPDSITLEEALALLEAKIEKGPAKKPARRKKPA